MAERAQISAESAFMRETPAPKATITNELLFGEQVEILGHDGKSWLNVRNLTDGYEGHILANSVSFDQTETSHRVKALRSFVYEVPDFKTEPFMALSFLSPVTLTDTKENGFALLEGGGWIFCDHVMKSSETYPDHTQTALRFEGTPYLWGGRTGTGLDCSALVQLSLLAAGHACPRDSHEQQQALGHDIRGETPQYGDLLFFRGHVGIMVNDTQILNATARHMMTCIEDLDQVSESYNGILAIKRLEKKP